MVELPEAPASATVTIKSKQGFSWLFTIRDTRATTLLTKIEEFETLVLGKGWIPDLKQGFKGPQMPVLDPNSPAYCPIHKVMMKERQGPTGSFYSHNTGKYPELVWCSGKMQQYHSFEGA